MTEVHGERPDTPVTEPAPTITSKARSDEWVVRTHHTTGVGYDGTERVRYERPVDEPAPTVDSRVDLWVVDRRTVSRGAGGGRVPTVPVPMDRPAPTFTGKSGHQWCFLRPATTVCGDARLSPPGWRGRPEDYDADGEYRGERSMDNAVKLTVEEALILQSFPPDYPVQGTRSKKFEQIGNAIPPGLAEAVLRKVA